MMKSLAGLVPARYKRTVVLAIIAFTVVAAVYAVILLAVPAGNGGNVQLVECVKGAPLTKIARDMEDKGLLRSAKAFVLLARFKGIDARAQAGTYQFNDGMVPGEILRKLVAGEIFAIRFAVPEGYSIYQLAELFAGKGIFSRAEFLAACFDGELLKELGITGNSVEGYLFPSTYNIVPGMKPSDCIRMMVEHFEKICGESIGPLFRERNRLRHELVIMASLIEKEAMVANECPTIASVFTNRLKKGMRLQSDPTAVYGTSALSGKVTSRDLHRVTPYNTYLINGLPPGPIGNPGLEALQAALAPSKTPYLYFVAKGDGTHFFSTTLDQHNSAVKKYLKDSDSKSSASAGMPGIANDNPSFTRRR